MKSEPTTMVQVGDPAPDLAFTDTSGRLRHLSEFWRARHVVLAFLRHFG